MKNLQTNKKLQNICFCTNYSLQSKVIYIRFTVNCAFFNNRACMLNLNPNKVTDYNFFRWRKNDLKSLMISKKILNEKRKERSS